MVPEKNFKKPKFKILDFLDLAAWLVNDGKWGMASPMLQGNSRVRDTALQVRQVSRLSSRIPKYRWTAPGGDSSGRDASGR